VEIPPHVIRNALVDLLGTRMTRTRDTHDTTRATRTTAHTQHTLTTCLCRCAQPSGNDSLQQGKGVCSFTRHIALAPGAHAPHAHVVDLVVSCAAQDGLSGGLPSQVTAMVARLHIRRIPVPSYITRHALALAPPHTHTHMHTHTHTTVVLLITAWWLVQTLCWEQGANSGSAVHRAVQPGHPLRAQVQALLALTSPPPTISPQCPSIPCASPQNATYGSSKLIITIISSLYY
jgi:hypothetical protein